MNVRHCLVGLLLVLASTRTAHGDHVLELGASSSIATEVECSRCDGYLSPRSASAIGFTGAYLWQGPGRLRLGASSMVQVYSADTDDAVDEMESVSLLAVGELRLLTRGRFELTTSLGAGYHLFGFPWDDATRFAQGWIVELGVAGSYAVNGRFDIVLRAAAWIAATNIREGTGYIAGERLYGGSALVNIALRYTFR